LPGSISDFLFYTKQTTCDFIFWEETGFLIASLPEIETLVNEKIQLIFILKQYNRKG